MPDEPDKSLADAAGAALDDTDPEGTNPGQLPGIDTAKVGFLGMAWDTVDTPELKEEIELTVRGMCVEVGDKVMANGEVRQLAKIKVTSVTRMDK